jgi:hypothetical protein
MTHLTVRFAKFDERVILSKPLVAHSAHVTLLVPRNIVAFYELSFQHTFTLGTATGTRNFCMTGLTVGHLIKREVTMSKTFATSSALEATLMPKLVEDVCDHATKRFSAATTLVSWPIVKCLFATTTIMPTLPTIRLTIFTLNEISVWKPGLASSTLKALRVPFFIQRLKRSNISDGFCATCAITMRLAALFL